MRQHEIKGVVFGVSPPWRTVVFSTHAHMRSEQVADVDPAKLGCTCGFLIDLTPPAESAIIALAWFYRAHDIVVPRLVPSNSYPLESTATARIIFRKTDVARCHRRTAFAPTEATSPLPRCRAGPAKTKDEVRVLTQVRLRGSSLTATRLARVLSGSDDDGKGGEQTIRTKTDNSLG